MVSGNRIGSALSGETICSYTRPLASAHIDGDDFKAYGINHVSTSEYRISHTPLDSTTGGTQTTWYQYPTPATDTGKITLGTPNAGLSVPTDTALQGLRPHYFELRDMRDAIESVALDYENPATATAYTLTVGTDNIFRIAIDSGQDDWTTATVTHKDRIREDYYSDIESVLTQLEQSALA
jgi:hypothetical protein